MSKGRYVIPRALWKTIWRGTGAQTAMVRCPKCGLDCSLKHEISDDGVVTPSLGCPYKGCNFHEWVTLEDWPNGGQLNIAQEAEFEAARKKREEKKDADDH